MTREEVQDLLAMVQATYPNYNPPSKTAAVNVWYMALEEYSADEVAMAFKAYMKTNTSGFAPAPGQLIAIANEKRKIKYFERLETELRKPFIQQTQERRLLNDRKQTNETNTRS